MNQQERIQERIAFLKEQLDSLDHYLPETYQFLTAELDLQQRELMEHKIQDFYWNQTNEQQNTITDWRDQTQSQKSDYKEQWIRQWRCRDWSGGAKTLWATQATKNNLDLTSTSE